MRVYFFDDKQKLIKWVDESQLIECVQGKEISADKSDLISNVLKVEAIYDKEVANAPFMAIEDGSNEFSLYRIINTSERENRLSLTGADFAYTELEGYIVKEIRPQDEPIGSVARRLLEGTEWQIGTVDSNLGTVSGSFYYTSVRESLKTLQTFGCELEFRIKLDSEGVTSKIINVKKQIGKQSDTRFAYDSNVLEIVKQVDRTNIFTSVIGRGRGEEVGETEAGEATYGRRIEFADVEWKKSNGDPLDKPKGQIYLEDKDLTAKYGIPTSNGGMRRRETVVIFEDEENPRELIKRTYKQLIELSRPLVQYKTKVLGSDALGNYITIHHHEKGWHYEARVFSISINKLTGEVTCGLGDNIQKTATKAQAQQANSIKNIEETKTSFYDSNKIATYQTDLIRGAGENGGSIFQMSPADTGQGTSRVPFQTVYMNGPNINASNNFLVLNSQGLGFLKGDFWKAKYENAWTIDGILNANFIRAGVLKGVLVEGNLVKSAHEQVHYQSIVDNGEFKIQEFKKTPDNFNYTDANWRQNVQGRTIGSWVGTTSAATGKANGTAILQHRGEIFSINTMKSNGASTAVVQVPADSTGEKPKLNLYGDKNFYQDNVFHQNVEIKGKLTLNGQQVYPGQGGGSGGGNGGGGTWNGTFPPGITSERDKNAWELYSRLLDQGHSKASACGVLGNVEQEVGYNMNPDTEQAGGPGYGCVQWDGSSYPLVGSPTWNGREYVQRLCNAAGIKDDYRTYKAQAPLIEWSSNNGQWIGQVSPSSWSGFKNETNPRTAAYAFEMNFERPAAAHPERQGLAQAWYDKFKDLSAPAGTGKYIKPMNSPIIITSEFGWRGSPLGGGQEFHNGMDIVNNSNKTVMASDGGTVVKADAQNWDWYGNYVVIRHQDGLYTGYAHLASMDVKAGQTVAQGQKIGIMGTTGPSTGDHLHFQFMKAFWPNGNGDFINPRDKINF